MVTRFSEHFDLNRTQIELDFVDVPLESDIPLFIDPFAISLETGEWFVACRNHVRTFFDKVLNCLRTGDDRGAEALMQHLGESNETRLGLSVGQPSGRGIGLFQSSQLLQSIRESRAFDSGYLDDLEDMELVIDGIGRDKISDMTASLIRGQLNSYTEDQCKLHGIPVSSVAGGVVWNAVSCQWESREAKLPIVDGKIVVLVPKVIVRRTVMFNHQEYYRHFIISYLRAEHLNAGTSMVRMLRSGPRVYKKDVMSENPISKGFIRDFTLEHPDVLDQYKESMAGKSEPLTNEEIESIQPEPKHSDPNELIERLRDTPTGRSQANAYHNLIIGILTYVFGPGLVNPTKEQEVDEGRKRIDLLFTNRASQGFFHDVSTIHRVLCPYVFVECKNYAKKIENPELDQMSGRFGQHRGKLGFVICRSVDDRPALVQKCKDELNARGGHILLLTDAEIVELVGAKSSEGESGVSAKLNQVLAELLL